MRLTQIFGLLALGLGASPVIAAKCKPSLTPSSSSSVVPSVQPSPSASAVCDPNANLIKNGDFSDNLTGWASSGGAAYAFTDCDTFTTCVSMQSQQQTDYLSQVIDTVSGLVYPITFYYAAID
ncbi:hypothetical protein Sste5346_005198 [Sporothrix stenoceras]|uniref:Uncharacterized protein n=1 Tax=Sporothrix stenoceras TaxID=5173 RepID=A0ABR3Z6F1_9PEZI